MMGEMGVVRGKVGVAVGKGAWLGRRWAWPRLKGRGHGIGAFSEGGGRGLMGVNRRGQMERGRGYRHVGVAKGSGGVVREWGRGRGGGRGLRG